MAREKIKLQEEAISEILVANTDSESGAEASDVEDYFEEEEEEEEEEAAATTTTLTAASLSRSRHNKHWPAKSPTQLCCHPCSSCGQRKGTQCTICDVGLCVVPCFAQYPTKVNL
jgi:hypothetical protein